jgi:membrane fusion protein (multidrug efflux system)
MKRKGKIALFVILGVFIILAGVTVGLRFSKLPGPGGQWFVNKRFGELKKKPPLLDPQGGEDVADAEKRKTPKRFALFGRTGPGISGQNPFGAQVETVFPVNTNPVTHERLEDYIKVNGDVVAETTVYVYPDISGKVTSIKVSVGDSVRKDQVVAMIDPSKPGSKYVKSPVKAPIGGTVTGIPVMLGATVSSTVPIVELGSLNRLHVETSIPERFVGKISIGRKAELFFDAYPGKIFSAKVVEMNPALDPVSRSLEIKLEFSDPGRLVKAGMFAEIKLTTEVREKVLAVPSNSVINRGGRQVVFVLGEDSKAVECEVLTGLTVDGMTEIIDGLSAGERVVTMGQTLIEDGVKVRVVNAEGEADKSGSEGGSK